MCSSHGMHAVPPHLLCADTPLYDMLKLFEIGRSHMAVLMQMTKAAEQRRRRER